LRGRGSAVTVAEAAAAVAVAAVAAVAAVVVVHELLARMMMLQSLLLWLLVMVTQHSNLVSRMRALAASPNGNPGDRSATHPKRKGNSPKMMKAFPHATATTVACCCETVQSHRAVAPDAHRAVPFCSEST